MITQNPRLNRLACFMLFAAAATAFGASQAPLPPITVPPTAILVVDAENQKIKTDLDDRYTALHARWTEWKRRADSFNLTYANRKFSKGSPEALAGASEQAWLTEALRAYKIDAAQFAADCDDLRIDRAKSMALMANFAKNQPMGEAKARDAHAMMKALKLDGNRTLSNHDIAAVWKTIEARDGDAAFAREAAAGQGPALFGSDTAQSFNDCTIFALASATGRPYGVIAAQATQMLGAATWRGEADRDHPQAVIERHGLNGDEVILLTASFGQAKLVASDQFAPTLQSGQPVLACINLVSDDKKHLFQHQVVLSRTFQHASETWFEMIDSNLGNNRRRHLSHTELRVLEENGVAYQPDEGRTIKLLR